MSTRPYGAYGEATPAAFGARLAYAGEVAERETGWYLLGDRPYSPVLRRFLSADHESPFQDGGFNRYAYCSGDPVNRIDPTGNAWTDWLTAGLMVALSVVATVVSAGALAGPAAAASAAATSAAMTATAAGGGFTAGVAAAATAAALTPGLMASATATVLDVVSTMAAIGSVASMAAQNQKANAIFGWVSMVSGLGSGGASIVAAKQLSNAARTGGAARGTFTGPAGSRASTTATAHTAINTVKTVTPLVASSASTGNGTRNATRSLAASDANASFPQLRRAAADLTANGARRSTLYSGAGSTRQAFRNPYVTRRRASGTLYRDVLETANRVGSSAGLNIETVDVARSTREHLRGRLSDDGIHVVVGGHGLVDDVTMRSLNVQGTLSDHLVSVRASM